MSPRSRPALARVLPFAVYILFLVLESVLGEAQGTAWLYPAQIALVLVLLAWFFRGYEELRAPRAVPARDWLLGAVVGIVVFVLWINLDFPWAQLGAGRGVAPDYGAEGSGRGIQLVRIVGVVLVVPVMEELFWRSFITRWIDNPEFQRVAPAAISMRALLITSVLFGLEHHLWLAGLVAGLLYGWLYRRTGNLWVVILAHALTNAVLELWVVRTGSWQFL